MKLSFRSGCMLAVAALVFAGCATPPPAPAPAPVVVAPEPPKPVAVPVPEVNPAQARAQAQKLTLDSITQLQNGDEAGATRTLDQALALDPANDLAKKLMEQIKADPQKELGKDFFRYTVQRDDSMSKIAQAYLGDRFRFYILARYNDIQNPSRLAAGQVLKIPGKARPAAATTTASVPASIPAAPTQRATPAAEAPDEATKAVIETPTPRSASMALMQQGLDLQKGGNLEGAYDAFREAAVRDPGNRDAIQQRDGARRALSQRFEREATQAFQRQNLDEAITKWDQVLALEPSNQKAKLERERAIDLRKKMSEKFGAK